PPPDRQDPSPTFSNDAPLIRPSGTFSPLRGEKGNESRGSRNVAPLPACGERVAEGRVRGASSTHQLTHFARMFARAKPAVLLISSITPTETVLFPGRTSSTALKISGCARTPFSATLGIEIGCAFF